MAARNFNHEQKTMQREVVTLFCKAVVAAPAGADTTATLTQNAGRCVASVTQADTGAGVLTITLANKYAQFLGLSITPVDGGTVDDWAFVPTAVDVASAKTITVASFKSGTATDVPNTCALFIEVKLTNSSGN